MADGAQRAFQGVTPEALSAVVGRPVSVLGGDDGLTPLLADLRAALDAAAVAVVSRAVVPERAVLAADGVPGDALPALAAQARALVSAAEDAAEPPAVPGLPGLAVHALPGSRDTVLVVAGAAAAGEDPLADVAVAVAAQRAGGALEAARLYADLDRAMAQILESDERMLGRIGLDIHDGPTQHLSVALLELQLLEADLGDAQARGQTLPDGLQTALERIYETLGGALTEMRELIGHLRPAQFEDRRLTDILQDAIIGFEARSGAQVTYLSDGAFPVNGVSVTQRITFYRILQEALNNAHRHGQARHVEVAVNETDEGITLRVADDGRGFDAENALRPRTGAPIARFGLHGMRDRASVLGGTFDVSSAEGEGTTVRVSLPRWRPTEDVQVPGPVTR